MKQNQTQRRKFLKGTAAASAISAFQIVPGYAAPSSKESRKNPKPPPSEKLNLAIIGCSHQGGGIGNGAIGTGLVDCVALCDVVKSRTNGLKKRAPEAKAFDDFREMFDKMGDKIDACTVGVPDHAHFPISMLAMSLGKHIYVEKPMAHTFHEAELMMAAEKKYKVACQMGNQGHSGNNPLQFKAWVDAGVIKNVRKVDACMNKGRRWHPWGDVKGFPAAGGPPLQPPAFLAQRRYLLLYSSLPLETANHHGCPGLTARHGCFGLPKCVWGVGSHNQCLWRWRW